MKVRRRELRIIALSALFSWEISKDEPLMILQDVTEMLGVTDNFDPEYTYARELFLAAVEGVLELDKAIETASSRWAVGRMPKVDLCIMRLAITEVLRLESSPLEIAINEACELAREFSTHASPRFVNGVLMGVFRAGGHARELPDSVK